MQIFDTLRTANKARQLLWNKGHVQGPLYRATELGGEVGELLNVVKKLERERLGLPGSRTTVKDLADELGDLIVCADLLADEYGIDLKEAYTRKFNATSEKMGFPVRLK